MSVGVLLATALIVSLGLACSGSIWLLSSAQSPLRRRWHRTRLERTVRLESADLDRKIVEMTCRMAEDDAA